MPRNELNTRNGHIGRKTTIQSRKKIVREKKVVDSDGVTRIIVGNCDFTLLLVVITLVLFGILMVFSASYYTTGTKSKFHYDMYYYFKKHIALAILGFIAMGVSANFYYEKIRKFSFTIYALAIIALILVIPFGTVVNGAKRWLWGIQPSEIAKIALILYLPHFILKYKNMLRSFTGFIFTSVVVIGIPTMLIAAEKSMSATLIIATIGMGIIFIACRKLIYFLPIIVLGIAAVIFMISGAAFRMQRFAAWQDPFAFSQGTGYQTVQSLYAIASGGLFGLGLGQSRQKLGYIPEGHNDIIFAIICEEFGLFGAIILVFLFMVFIWRGIKIAMNSISLYGTFVASGITIMVAVQVIINIAVVTNTIPNTGIPMPFISYGGTSLVIMMCAVGFLLNISRYYKE